MSTQASIIKGREPLVFPLVDFKTGKKCKIGLRRIPLKTELAALPKDPRKLHNLFVELRLKESEDVYKLTLVWMKLSAHQSYWRDFNQPSEHAYLMAFGFPAIETLIARKELVEFFDQTTFILVGEWALRYMVLCVEQYQNDRKVLQRDYQRIFERYSAGRISFDRSVFLEIVRDYVRKVYEEPRARKERVSIEAWRQSHRATLTGGDSATLRFRANKGEGSLKLAAERCPRCVDKNRVIEVLKRHMLACESVIREKLGKEHIPARSTELEKFLL